METIKIYLENMFKTLPNTAELRKLKGEILGNMEEKYQELKAEGKTENEAIGIVIFITGIYSERAITYGAAVVVLIVSVAVFLFINLGGCDDGHKKLLKEGEYSDEVRKNNKVIGAVASIVWPLAVAVFLLWSFIFNAWGISWIVFPVTGVIFGGFAAVYTALHGKEESF